MLIKISNTHNIRDWAQGSKKVTDDSPYGGGPGMVVSAPPVYDAVKELKKDKSKVIYMAPDGNPLSSSMASDLSKEEHIIIISGHYEGIDQRIRDNIIDAEISIGDYILTNGTLPSIVLVDAISRFIPGFLGDEKSLTNETFMNNLLGFPQYTRPETFCGMDVPKVLLSGNHKSIEKWRKDKQFEKTKKIRPDLLN